MKNFKKAFLPAVFALVLAFSLSGCDLVSNTPSSDSDSDITDSERPDDDNEVSQIEDDETDSSEYTLDTEDAETGTYTYTNGTGGNSYTFTVEYSSGTEGCYSVTDNTLTFSGITEDSVYVLSGSFPGNIVVSVGEDYELELEFNEFTVTSSTEVPLYIESADKVTISAKKGTPNYIYDNREEVDSDGISGSVYALSDLDIQGKGSLYVKSANNNGIHTKKDLQVKNLTLQVECKDNALKGNDSVSIESGTITLIATQGDGIKTTNSDISSKGKQRGTVAITGGTVLIYAACDGIDASYNVEISEGDAAPVIQVFTDKYSSYSEEVTATSEDTYYIRYTSTTYKYSIMYYNDDSDYVWYSSSSYETVVSSSGMGGMGGMGGSSTTYYYYPITKPGGYSYMTLYVYSGSQSQEQTSSCVASKNYTVNDNYDTIAITANRSSSSSLSFSWTNYTTTTQTGMGGMGGITEGNSDKGDYSTKGFKAANEIIISAGEIQISSYDDAIHSNCDTTLENEEDPLGNVTITGGTLSLYSNDDAIHADEEVTISDGTVTIGYSYEGIEGSIVTLSGGTISVIATDDGVNGTSTTEQSIEISGGYLYVYAGGDGVDSNTGSTGNNFMGGVGSSSSSSYNGLLISGGHSVIISTGSSDSCIDTEVGYTYTGGYVLGVMVNGGMTSEPTSVKNFSSIGKSTSLSSASYVVVTNYVTVKLPSSMNAFVVFLSGTSSVTIGKSSTTGDASFDSNGVCWNV